MNCKGINKISIASGERKRLCRFLLFMFARFGILLFVLSFLGCSRESTEFRWSDDIAQLTGKDLNKWLRRAPFLNEITPKEENQILFTNAAQVFPFMGRYYNATGELEFIPNSPKSDIYERATVLYQDPEWGDLFLDATLLYDQQEVFLDRYYRQSGNVLIGGGASALNGHIASLNETAVYAKSDAYKTGIYWANTAARQFLIGFYQKDNLVFQTAIPLHNSDTLETWAKLNVVNHQLGLDITEWLGASPDQLSALDSKETFWKDPFVELYQGENFLPRLRLKIRDTPLQQAERMVSGDHYFAYQGTTGKVSLYTLVKDTEDNLKAFDKTHGDLAVYRIGSGRLYYHEKHVGEKIMGIAKTYFKPGQCLEIHFEYPMADKNAKDIIHGVLQHVKIRKY